MNDELNEEIFDEGLLDRIIDTISGKSAKGGQFAKNLKAYVKGDASAIKSPEQVDNLRKFERNIDRIKQKFDKLVGELGKDLTSAIGTPDEGPFKDVIDEFDSAVEGFHAAINRISVEIDKVDDTLPPKELPAPKEKTKQKSKDKSKDKPEDKPADASRSEDNEDSDGWDEHSWEDEDWDEKEPAVLEPGDGEEPEDGEYGFDDRGVYRKIKKPALPAGKPLNLSDQDQPAEAEDPFGSNWGGHETWEEDLTSSTNDFPPIPEIESNLDEEENDYKSPTFFDDDLDDLDQTPNLSENTKQILETWQRIIS